MSELRSKIEELPPFLAGLLHDLRNQVQVTVNISTLLSDMPVANTRQKRWIDAMQQASLLLSRQTNMLINEWLGEGMGVEESYFRLHPLSDMVMQGLEVLSETKKIRLKINIGAEVPEVLWGDALCLSQVLINLLRNAIQHAPEESEVLLAISLQEQAVSGPVLRFDIRDEGPGFPEGILHELGQPFHSGPSSEQGWGLGLFMVHRWIELMEGEWRVENLPEKGSLATVILPFGRNRRKEDAPEGAEEQMAFSMLVVEDNELSREALRSVLIRNFPTAHIYAAGTVEEVLQLIKDHPRISLALIDLYLHGHQDGQRLAERIKTLSPDCNIIAMSAMPMLRVNPPFSHYLAKPIRPPELVTAISRFMSEPVNG